MAKDSSSSQDVVLSYYDCLLRTSDVDLLKGPYWLNDVIIGFYFEYLNEKLNKDGKKKLLFVCPELTQLLKMTDPSQYDMFLGPIDASSSEFIFFPLNDCNRTDAAGGTHWSLLIYWQEKKTCYHYDSSKGSNSHIAADFARNINTYFHGTSENSFVEAPCPQQDNGYDCGLFVLCLADVISEFLSHFPKLPESRCNGVKKLVKIKRVQLLDLIDILKRRSLNSSK